MFHADSSRYLIKAMMFMRLHLHMLFYHTPVILSIPKKEKLGVNTWIVEVTLKDEQKRYNRKTHLREEHDILLFDWEVA